MDELLRPIERITVPRTEAFAVNTRFALDLSAEAHVLIAMIGGSFVRWFSQKNEDAVEPCGIDCLELQSNASNAMILEASGGPAVVATSLGVASWFLHQQPKGEAGPLATNGWGNIFFAKDVAGQLRAVYVHWCEDAWSIEATSIESPAHWPIRDRVFRPVP